MDVIEGDSWITVKSSQIRSNEVNDSEVTLKLSKSTLVKDETRHQKASLCSTVKYSKVHYSTLQYNTVQVYQISTK